MTTTWLRVALATLAASALACGSSSEDSGDSGDGGGVDGSVVDASCPATEPICGAFENSGSAGGHVEVTIAEGGDEAIVLTSSLPDYEATDFGTNPNPALPQSFEFHVPLSPTAGPSEAGLGHVGVAWNGVSMFNPSDARDIGGCTGNAAYLEADGMDEYGGHPTERGEYHYHTGDFLAHASELGLSNEPGAHSSLVGYAFDGVPVYGSYGFADGAGGSIAELRSCYRLKAERDCCLDGPRCSIGSTLDGKPLDMGAFVEDFEFDEAGLAAGDCDLDEFNSRVTATPEYPSPVRVYVMTFDGEGHAAFPFIFGTRYWGTAADQP
jgi:hypothetical protein